jgi:maltooligosyltrehalose synthase
VGPVWRDTAVEMPPVRGRFVDAITGTAVGLPAGGGSVSLRTLLATFPVALLVPEV